VFFRVRKPPPLAGLSPVRMSRSATVIDLAEVGTGRWVVTPEEEQPGLGCIDNNSVRWWPTGLISGDLQSGAYRH
jgi:hypothetical protein